MQKIGKYKFLTVSLVAFIVIGIIAGALFLINQNKHPEDNGDASTLPTEEELRASDEGLNAVRERQGKTYYEVMQEIGSDEEKQSAAVSSYEALVLQDQINEAIIFRSTVSVDDFLDEYALSMYVYDTIIAKSTNNLEDYRRANEKILSLDIVINDSSLLSYWKENISAVNQGSFPEDRPANTEELYSDEQ